MVSAYEMVAFWNKFFVFVLLTLDIDHVFNKFQKKNSIKNDTKNIAQFIYL
jgi:hypothetical protein